MPRIKSAKKRVETNERNRKRNLAVKSEIKTLIKKVSDLVTKKDEAKAKEAANEAFKKLDIASRKRTVHPNKAARQKSRISKWLKTLEA